MTHDEYLAYLDSPFWRARRQAVMLYRGERCQRCRSASNLQLHHKTYERLGRELPQDVELLCRNCHAAEHGITDSHVDHRFLAQLRLTNEVERLFARLKEIQAPVADDFLAGLTSEAE